MKVLGREFLEKTNGGLDIFQKYINYEFIVGEPTTVDDIRFTVKWNDHYENYAVYIECLKNAKWQMNDRLNAIWFVKEKFSLTEDEVYSKINREMNLGILREEQPKEVDQ
jgi:hypothetical protein